MQDMHREKHTTCPIAMGTSSRITYSNKLLCLCSVLYERVLPWECIVIMHFKQFHMALCIGFPHICMINCRKVLGNEATNQNYFHDQKKKKKDEVKFRKFSLLFHNVLFVPVKSNISTMRYLQHSPCKTDSRLAEPRFAEPTASHPTLDPILSHLNSFHTTKLITHINP